MVLGGKQRRLSRTGISVGQEGCQEGCQEGSQAINRVPDLD